MSGPSSRVAAAEVASAIVAVLGLLAAFGSRLVRWLVHWTKSTDQLELYRGDVIERFDRLERWCGRVDDFIAANAERRIADERFTARTDIALASLTQRIGRVERVQDHAA